LSGLAKRLGSAAVVEAIAADLAEFVREHLFRRNNEPNKQGFPKSGFWASIANGVQGIADGLKAVVVIPYPFRQKYYGGEIVAGRGARFLSGGALGPVKPPTYLTIPLTAAAYGHRAGEFEGLVVKYIKGQGLCLVMNSGGSDLPFYRLVKRVNQHKDPNALPSDAAFSERMRGTLSELALA
jgi:hypothetical protein